MGGLFRDLWAGFPEIDIYHIGLITRKHVFLISDGVRLQPVSSATENSYMCRSRGGGGGGGGQEV